MIIKKTAQAMGQGIADAFLHDLLRVSSKETSTVLGAAQGYDGLVHQIRCGKILLHGPDQTKHYYSACRAPEVLGEEIILSTQCPTLVPLPVTCLRCLAEDLP